MNEKQRSAALAALAVAMAPTAAPVDASTGRDLGTIGGTTSDRSEADVPDPSL